jgi:tetraacyldisaccharide 4'-kinase
MQRQLAPYALRSDGRHVPLAQLADRPLHALAAVARPERFFAMLQARVCSWRRPRPCPITMILRAGSGRRIQTRC